MKDHKQNWMEYDQVKKKSEQRNKDQVSREIKMKTRESERRR